MSITKMSTKRSRCRWTKFKHFFVYSHSHNMILCMIDNDKISIPKTVVDVGVCDDLPFAWFVTPFRRFKYVKLNKIGDAFK